MRRAAACLAVVAALCAGPATGSVRFGASEDAMEFAEDGGASLFGTMTGAGMSIDAVDVYWNPSQPTRVDNAAKLQRMLATAQAANVQVVFHVYPVSPVSLVQQTRSRIAAFAGFLKILARGYPEVTRFIVGNEPNQPRFLRPQFGTRGKQVSAATYEKLLAASYDALKSVDQSIDVIGVALSPRGNDDPDAPSNISTSPVRFLRALGDAYRRSGRLRPLMDQFAFHPYSNRNTDPPAKGYAWPNAGVPNLARIKQAVWDAFHGTAQPTFAEAGRRSSNALKMVLDELAWQVRPLPSLADMYFGAENVAPISEEFQARYYSAALSMLRCDPAVTDILLFRLIDEPNLDRFQSGLLRIDGSVRPALAAVTSTIAAPATCKNRTRWRHSTRVAGAKVSFDPSGTPLSAVVSVRAEEASTVTAGLVSVPDGGVLDRRQVVADLLGGRALSARSGPLPPHRRVELLFPRRGLGSGSYAYVVVLRAEMNPSRRSVFVSPTLRVRG
jgi:hypothetical protein